MRRARWAAPFVATTLFVATRPAHAHTVGLSVADFDVQGDGAVEARLMFATAEPLGGLTLDRDHDGRISPGDVTGARDDLRAFFLQGVEVDADGAACPASFEDAALTEVDGLVLAGRFACPGGAAQIEVTLYYLSALPRGHREIASIRAGDRTVAELLTADRRGLALTLRPGGRRLGASHRRFVALAIGAAVAALVGWGASRWRGARNAWQNRPP